MTEQSQHARLGASSSRRWINCPGSIRASEGMPTRSSHYALEGTAAHEIAARCIRQGMDPEVFTGMTLTVPDDEGEMHEIEITSDMIESVQLYTNQVRLAMSTAPKNTRFWVEHQFDLSPLEPPEPMYGTVDYAQFEPADSFLHVVDFKHGEGVRVDLEEDTQLTYYALGAVVESRMRPKRIRLTVVQPRCHHPDGPIRSKEMTWQELVDFKKRLFAKAEETHNPNAPLNPGEWCRFCPAAPRCPALHAATEQVVGESFANLVPVEESSAVEEKPSQLPAPTQKPSQLPAPTQLTDEQIREVMDKKDLVLDWFRAIERYVYGRLHSEPFPGFKLVEKRGRRYWKDEQEVKQWAMQEGLGSEIYEKSLRSPHKVEKLLREHDRSAKDLPEELYEKRSSGLKVVSEDHPSPAVTPHEQLSDAFAGVLPAGETLPDKDGSES